MKTLLALDSFKGSLTAPEAVDAAASALAERDVLRLPLSDGGEGFSACLAGCLGGIFRTVTVHDPLGRPVHARYALLENGRIAVIETAAASGLTLLKPEEDRRGRCFRYRDGLRSGPECAVQARDAQGRSRRQNGRADMDNGR